MIDDNKNMKMKAKKQCSHCKKLFYENDLDLVDGNWLCRNCEDILQGVAI